MSNAHHHDTGPDPASELRTIAGVVDDLPEDPYDSDPVAWDEIGDLGYLEFESWTAWLAWRTWFEEQAPDHRQWLTYEIGRTAESQKEWLAHERAALAAEAEMATVEVAAAERAAVTIGMFSTGPRETARRATNPARALAEYEWSASVIDAEGPEYYADAMTSDTYAVAALIRKTLQTEEQRERLAELLTVPPVTESEDLEATFCRHRAPLSEPRPPMPVVTSPLRSHAPPAARVTKRVAMRPA